MARGKVVRSWNPHERRSDSEFKRGYRDGKELLEPFRSLWIERGYVWGYTKQKVSDAGNLRMRTNNWDGGYAKALREALKEKPKRATGKSRSVLHPIRTNEAGRPLALGPAPRQGIF